MTLAKSGVGTFLSKERRQGLDSVSRFGTSESIGHDRGQSALPTMTTFGFCESEFRTSACRREVRALQ